MFNSIKNNSTWVYGPKIDSMVFGLPIILAFVIGAIWGTKIYIPYIIIMIDQPHVYSSYLFTYNSKRFSKKFKIFLIIVPVFFILTSWFLIQMYGFGSSLIFLGIYTVIHFYKQQAAWFKISSGKEKIKIPYEKFIDNNMIFFSIMAPSILSMINGVGRDGWRQIGDLPYLPDYIDPYVTLLWILSTFSFCSLQIYKIIKYKILNIGKIFHIITAILIWVIYRLEPFENGWVYGSLIIIMPHAIAYFYLGINYMKKQYENGERFYINIPSLPYFPFFFILFAIGISWGEIFLIRFFDNDIYAHMIANSLAMTHFTLDAVLWKAKYNPEGLDFIRN